MTSSMNALEQEIARNITLKLHRVHIFVTQHLHIVPMLVSDIHRRRSQ
jgi:hypothetical protein